MAWWLSGGTPAGPVPISRCLLPLVPSLPQADLLITDGEWPESLERSQRPRSKAIRGVMETQTILELAPWSPVTGGTEAPPIRS